MKADGGAAFPELTEIRTGSHTTVRQWQGMTLRDYFAGQALCGILTAWKMIGPCENAVGSCKNVAAMAYANADAMLAERERTGANNG